MRYLVLTVHYPSPVQWPSDGLRYVDHATNRNSTRWPGCEMENSAKASTTSGSRSQEASTRIVWSILIILFLALGMRLALAPAIGSEGDIKIFEGWMRSSVEFGVVRSYEKQVHGNMNPNYPPVILFIYNGIGYLYTIIVSPKYEVIQPQHRIFVKLPAILADLVTCVMLFSFCRWWLGNPFGLFGALAYALHPGAIYDSAYWGQNDSIYTAFILASLISLIYEWPVLVGAFAALAALSKPQAVIFLPILSVGIFLGSSRVQSYKAILGGVAASLVVLLPILAEGAVQQVLNVYTHAVGYYKVVSMGAFNFWWALFGDSAYQKQSTDLLIPGVSYRSAGLALFGLALLFCLWGLASNGRGNTSKESALDLFFASALTALAFYMLNTEMHERYFFPFIALGLPVAFVSWKTAALYTLLSLTTLMNLVAIVPFSSLDQKVFQDFPTSSVVIAYANVLLFCLLAALAWERWRPARRRSLPGFSAAPYGL
jgi:Gpi18-like mannosyltransferase